MACVAWILPCRMPGVCWLDRALEVRDGLLLYVSPDQPGMMKCSISSNKEADMLGTILLILLIILLIASIPTWPYSAGWGYYPSGALGLILVIILIQVSFFCWLVLKLVVIKDFNLFWLVLLEELLIVCDKSDPSVILFYLMHVMIKDLFFLINMIWGEFFSNLILILGWFNL